MQGIYLITVNRGPGEPPYFYVGQAEDIQLRKNDHLSELRRGVHHDRKPRDPDPLQACFNKYGEDALEWDILEPVDYVEQLTERETTWYWYFINRYDSRRVLNQCVPSENPMRDPDAVQRMLDARGRNRVWLAAVRKSTAEMNRSPERRQATAERSAKTYTGFVSPTGEVFAPVHNLHAFCREHGLDQSCMVRLSQERQPYHKGWTRYEPS